MIGEICAEIKNYFVYEGDRIINDWVISDGMVSPLIDIPTDYIRITGSRFNNGVHKREQDGSFALNDESFHGAIWIMSPPADFLAIVDEISAWQAKYGGITSEAMSPFNSESYNGYAYSKSGGTNGGSSGATWQSAYASRLRKYRRIREL